MKSLLLCLSVTLSLCSGCSTVEKPYIKETITSKDGTVRTIESSADRATGAGLDAFRKMAPTR
jgi:uncharacterized protein YceK